MTYLLKNYKTLNVIPVVSNFLSNYTKTDNKIVDDTLGHIESWSTVLERYIIQGIFTVDSSVLWTETGKK